MKAGYIFLPLLLLLTSISFGQTKFNKQIAGHVFYLDIPDYMTKTVGLNDVASIQYKSTVKDVYTIAIEDSKEDLAILEIHYSTIKDFQEEFANDFLKDEDKRTISKALFKTKDNINFAEFEASYFDKDSQLEIYYLIGIVETKTHFYKVLSWTTLENKDKYKADFQKIIYSLKD